MQGTCLCARIRYTLEATPILSFACHCLDCQMSTGSAFGLFTIVKSRDFKLEGATKSFSCKADSGRTITRHFCDVCGSPLYNTLEKAPASSW